jgi:hypothetical protein
MRHLPEDDFTGENPSRLVSDPEGFNTRTVHEWSYQRIDAFKRALGRFTKQGEAYLPDGKKTSQRAFYGLAASLTEAIEVWRRETAQITLDRVVQGTPSSYSNYANAKVENYLKINDLQRK